MTATQERPTSSESELPVADTLMTRDNVNDVPYGSSVRNSTSGRTWTREHSGRWRSDQNTTVSSATMARRASYGHVSFVSGPQPTPAETDTNDQTPMGPHLSLDQFAQRFATLMWGGHQHAGMGHGHLIQTALHQTLAIPEYDPMIGLSVCFTNHSLIDRLPADTVLITEGEPGDQHFTVYKKRTSGGGLERILGAGDITGPNVVLLIESMPNSTAKAPWVDAPGSDSELAEINTFRAKAWAAAMSVKSSTGWCGELEGVVYRSGIDSRAANQTPTPLLTAEQVAELPVGTFLRYTSTHVLLENARTRVGKTAVYVRDDAAENPAKTRRIGGILPGSWVPAENEVVHRPGENMNFLPTSSAEIESMPLGTRVGDTSGTYYEKGEPDGHGNNWFAGNRQRAYKVEQLGLHYAYRVIPHE